MQAGHWIATAQVEKISERGIRIMKVQIPYGRERITAGVEDKRVAGVIRSHLDEYVPDFDEQELVLNAMRHPIASPALE